jgi:MFS family permease
MGVTLHSLVRRVPMALGPILGGALILKFGERDGVRLAFAAALVMALIAAGIQQIFIPPDEPGRRRTSRTSPIEVLGRMRRPLRNLLAADILIRFCEQIPYAYLAIWCIRETGAVNALEFGTLTAVEMATAMVVYIPVAYYADRAGKKPFILITFAIFTAFPLALFWARSFWPLVAAFVIRGLKEFGEPTRKALIMDLSPEDGQASMFGAYYLLRDVFVSLAALGGAFLWQASPALNLFTAFGFGLAGTLWFARFGANDPRSSRPATAVG